MKCNNCIHEDICIYHGHMEKFESEIRDKKNYWKTNVFMLKSDATIFRKRTL